MLYNNYLLGTDSTWRHQISGIAMGNAAAPTIANIYVPGLEILVIERFPIKPLFYKRYINDVFMVWPASAVKEITSFFGAFTQIAPSITFNVETSDERAEFLDLYIFKGERFKKSRILTLIS